MALEISLEENLDNIARSIEAIVAKEREPLFDAEHFFDGYKADPDYALTCIKAAHEAGAQWLVLCDTNGGTLPEDVYRIVSEVKAKLPGAQLGIHAHNDTEQAVAVSLAAVRAGARQVQGTLNGLGERCGNANLCSLMPNLMLKEPYASQFETGVSSDNLARITHVSRLLDEILNRAPNRHARLCRRLGLRAQGRASFFGRGQETRKPTSMCRRNRWATSVPCRCRDQSGRANVLVRLANLDIDGDKPDASRACWKTSSSANSRAMPMTVPKPRSSFWRGARGTGAATISTSSSFSVTVEACAKTRGQMRSPSPKPRWN